MQVTSLGSSMAAAPATTIGQEVVPVNLVLPMNFPAKIEPQQMSLIQARVEKFDFASMPAQQIALLGQEPTANLNRVLDGFLGRINKQENPQLFKLVDTLSDAIAKEKIGDLAEQMLSAKPTLMEQFIGLFSKKKLREAMDRAYEELGRVAKGKSKTLADLVTGMERQLQTEMNKLNEELRQMDALKAEYRNSFDAFATEVVFLHNALAKAQAQAPALLAAAEQDVIQQQDILDKLQALESVALSREAMMTRMPAEQLIIRQLQNAGVSTLQELAITMGDRFASIRMTLLGIHGANMVRNVQRLGQANADLDANLQAARSKLTQAAVTTAANAPGDNRLKQAEDLKRVVADTKALQDIVVAARDSNKQKFEEARNTMAQVRQDMLALGQQLNPAATVAAQNY